MDSVEQYLNDTFLAEEDFISLASCSVDELILWQQMRIFPLPSYAVQKEYTVTSFFGNHKTHEIVRWYPKGLNDWVTAVRKHNNNIDLLKAEFSQRYQDKVEQLRIMGIYN